MHRFIHIVHNFNAKRRLRTPIFRQNACFVTSDKNCMNVILFYLVLDFFICCIFILIIRQLVSTTPGSPRLRSASARSRLSRHKKEPTPLLWNACIPPHRRQPLLPYTYEPGSPRLRSASARSRLSPHKNRQPGPWRDASIPPGSWLPVFARLVVYAKKDTDPAAHMSAKSVPSCTLRGSNPGHPD